MKIKFNKKLNLTFKKFVVMNLIDFFNQINICLTYVNFFIISFR
jgi:hypothetical protein